MDINGEQVTLTPSEADWMQNLRTLLFRKAPGLAQKILDARVAFISPHMPADELPTITEAEARVDGIAHARLASQTLAMHDFEMRHGVDETGVERHVIALTMTREEKMSVLGLAQRVREIAVADTTDFTAQSAERQEIAQSLVDGAIAMDSAEDRRLAREVAAYIQDPEVRAERDEYRFTEALHEINVTSGIIHAIEADAAKA